MHKELEKHLICALQEFASGKHYDQLIEAKDTYFNLTGWPLEEDEDYESRMNSFNDWYLFQFVSKQGNRPPIETYLENREVEEDMKVSLLSYNHSVFQYMGENRKGQYTLKDILHNKKLTLASGHPAVLPIKGEIFMGRTLEYKAGIYLTTGMTFLPRETISILKKEVKKVRRLRDPGAEIKFLLFTEFLKTKWQRYRHVELDKIFVYPKA